MTNFIRSFIAFGLAAMLCACGGQGGKSDGAGASGGDTSANLPMGLPLMAGTTVVSNNNGKAGAKQTNATATLTSTESVDDVFEYYEEAMADAGFENSRETEVEDIRVLTASRDGAMGMVTVRPEGGKAQVMIVLRNEPAR